MFNIESVQVANLPPKQVNINLGLHSTATSSQQQAGNKFIRHYKDITFDTLKERHDNFSFEKVLQTQKQVYNTMHITGIIERPNNPNLMLFLKQGNQEKLTKEYSNSKYQNNSESVSFYDQFTKRLNMQSNERQRPRIGVSGENLDMASTAEGGRRDTSDAYQPSMS